MRKVICSPGSYIQGEGELKQLAQHYQLVGNQGAYLIVDKFINDTYHDEIVKSFEENKISYQVSVFGGECSKREIARHQSERGSCDVIFGIGGGKTLDTAKAVAFYLNLPVVIVPTAASSDAPCSRLSVVYTDAGEFDEYLFLTSNPDMVIMDTEVIAKAPVRFLVAGIGDALATYYEAAACEKSGAITMAGGHVTKAAITLAELCRDTLLEYGLMAKLAVEKKVCTQAVEAVVEANTYLSGVGFESGGLSAAHAIHNGLTVLKETHHMLHGEKVAFGTLSQLVLENRPQEEIRKIALFCKELGLPTTFKELGMEQVSEEALMAVAAASCAEGDTMGNMPFKISSEAVVAAMKVADQIGTML